MRISILSNVNLDMLSGLLKKKNQIFQPDGYGEWITYALRSDNRMLQFKPECIILLLDGNELLKNCKSKEENELELDHTNEYIKKMAENYKESYLLVSTIDVKNNQIKAGDACDSCLQAAAYWDKKLSELSAHLKNVHRFELRNLIENYGRTNFYSDKFWYMGSIPYDMKALHSLALEIQCSLDKLRTLRRKVLVLDLDNTLWGGVIGEDGVEGITLDSAHEGAIYQDAQREIKKMQQMGVLLAIASKNNMDDVRKVFEEHPHMILKESDFVSMYVNWEPKWDNIRKMALELNLGLDSFVFVDDNEAEREAMRLHEPEVEVVDFPQDITKLADCMRKVYENYFWSWELTEEDQKKTIEYRQEKKREEDKKSAVSYEEYLKSLHTKIKIEDVSEETKTRAVQLMNKTNQFNVCTIRMDELELEKYQKEKKGHILIAEVSDKYGNSGWVVELLYHMDGKIALIDNLLMSCRVMGRCIEDAIADAFFEKLFKEGVCEIQADYIRTAKNKPVEELWDKLGFVCVERSEDRKKYRLTLDEYKKKDRKNKIHTVIWNQK